MDTTTPTTQSSPKETEIDLVELAQSIWKERKFVLKITAIFAAIGLFVAIFSPKEYTSSVIMVPQIGSKSSGSSLAGLAAMAGVDLSSMSKEEVLSPTIYPKILGSVPFKKDLMQTKVKFEKIPQEITLYEYYTNPDYQKFNLLSSIKKYTLGLPGVIIGAIKGKPKEEGLVEGTKSSILSLTEKENRVARTISKQVNLSVDKKEGSLTLTANMPEALASAQVADAARILLQQYITNFKIEKATQNLEFIEGRCREAKQEFESKQRALAYFRDANRNVISAMVETQEEKLSGEFNISYSVYSELAKQLEQAKIKVKDATPVLTIIEPTVIPNRKTKPNRPMILFGFILFGGFIGVGRVTVKILLDSYRKKE